MAARVSEYSESRRKREKWNTVRLVRRSDARADDATRHDERLVARGRDDAVRTRANFTRSLVAADRGILKNA